MAWLATLNLEWNLIISNNWKPINSISSSELKKLKEIFLEKYPSNYIDAINTFFEGVEIKTIVITIKKMINDYESNKIVNDALSS